jgi:hypothetical protein
MGCVACAPHTRLVMGPGFAGWPLHHWPAIFSDESDQGREGEAAGCVTNAEARPPGDHRPAQIHPLLLWAHLVTGGGDKSVPDATGGKEPARRGHTPCPYGGISHPGSGSAAKGMRGSARGACPGGSAGGRQGRPGAHWGPQAGPAAPVASTSTGAGTTAGSPGQGCPACRWGCLDKRRQHWPSRREACQHWPSRRGACQHWPSRRGGTSALAIQERGHVRSHGTAPWGDELREQQSFL